MDQLIPYRLSFVTTHCGVYIAFLSVSLCQVFRGFPLRLFRGGGGGGGPCDSLTGDGFWRFRRCVTYPSPFSLLLYIIQGRYKLIMLTISCGKYISLNSLLLSKSKSNYPSARINLPHQWGKLIILTTFYWLTILPVLIIHGRYH